MNHRPHATLTHRDRVVDDLMDEARTVGGRLARMRRVLVVAEHPPMQ